MRKAIIAVAVLLAIVVGLAAVAPFLVPNSVYRTQIETHASQALGRSVVIGGDVAVSVFPKAQARARAVTIANAPGFSGDTFASVQELRASVEILPLLSRRVEIKEFVLMQPQLNLEARRDGAVNWVFTPQGEGASAPSTSTSGPFKRRPGSAPVDASLGDVRIVDGSARYADLASGQSHDISAINASLALASLSAPMTLDAKFALDGAPTTVTVRLDSLKGFLEGEAAPLRAKLANDLIAFDVEGRFEPGEDVAFAGDVSLASTDLRGLAASAGVDLPPGDVYRAFSARGMARGDASSVRFDDAALKFDDISGKGRFALALSGARPRLTGELALGDVDVTPYMPEATTSEGARGPSGPAAWSEAPIDLSMLKTVDASLSLSVTSLTVDTIRFERSAIAVALENARLQADLTELAAYGGAGSAQAVVNARTTPASYALKANVDGLQAEPFLRDAAKFTRLRGVGQTKIDVTARGDTQAAIMKSLSGTGSFAFADGALTGVNLVAAARGLGQALQGTLPTEAFAANAETDFSKIASGFTLADGVATLNAFQVDSPFLKVAGAGAFNLADQSVAISLRPTLLETAGVGSDVAGLALPIKIEGAWSAMSIGVDRAALNDMAEAALKARAGDEITKAIDRNIGGAAGDLLRGALGAPARGTSAPEAPSSDAAATGAAADVGAGADADAATDAETAGEPEEEPKSLEEQAKEKAEEELNKALGGLFKRD